MRQPWWERVKWWICDHFGHRPYGEPLLNGARWCKRCGRAVNVQ